MNREDQDLIWRKEKYRGPDDFVVKAYALPKLNLIESVLPFKGFSVLDVGCGPGLFSAHLKPRARWVVGIDISWSMLHRAKGIEVVLADALSMPFPDESFDIVFFITPTTLPTY